MDTNTKVPNERYEEEDIDIAQKDWHAFCAGDSIVVGRGCDPNCEIELRAVFGPCDIYCTVDEPRAT